ncbi:hypothetical protein [Lachnoclostridium sp.]|nr:hypothetical protein [Lachnoclostridium sp.]
MNYNRIIPDQGDDCDLTNLEIFEVINYINDTNQESTQVLMMTDIDDIYF